MKLNHNKISCIKLVHLLYLSVILSATDSPDIIAASVGFLVTKLYAM